MTPEQGGCWFFLVVHRPDKKYVVLDRNELSLIPTATLAAITAEMSAEGITAIWNEVGEWSALAFNEKFCPYTLPPCIQELAEYVPTGTVITLDNGCLPSIEWRFMSGTVDVFDDYDSLPAET